MTRLILPGLHGQEPTMVCTVPIDDENLCLKPFWPGEERAWQKHVGECARAHAEAIERRRLAERIPIFDEENWDPEVAEHMRKVGERMKAEGRLEVKPSERAGFS